MHILNPEIRQPLLRRMLRQTLVLVGTCVLTLSVSSYIVAKTLLLGRAELHVVTLSQATVDLVEQELRDMRTQVGAIARDPRVRPGADVVALFKGEYPSIKAVSFDAVPRTETVLVPIVDRDGWQAVAVSTSHGSGSVTVEFSVHALLERLAVAARASGRTADILFGREVGGELQILRVTELPERAALVIGDLREQAEANLVIARATQGEHRRGEDEDYRGIRTVSAGNDLPSLGWGVSAQIDAAEVLGGVRLLGIFHALLGAAFLLLAAVAASFLARRLTAPLRSLAQRTNVLGPGHWDMQPTLTTQDEVALLERVMADMASRLHDFTENLEKLVHQRTQALREQYALDRAVLRAVEYGVVTVDTRGCDTGMNPAAEAMLAVRLGDVLGAETDRIVPLSLDGKALLHAEHPLHKALMERQTVRTAPGVRWTLALADREARTLALIATPLVTGDKLFGAVLVFQDITEQRQMEELKSEFITLASHQLRTPLSIMQWQIEALEGGVRVEERQVQEMQNAAKRMTAIVNALLQVAKLEGGALTPTLAPVDAIAVVREAAEEAKAIAKDVRIDTDVTPTLPMSTDAVLLKIVLQNLLENAVKYSSTQGAVIVKASSQDACAVISVHDDGMGIPEAEQKHVFEKFFRGQNVRKQSTDGTGLGLYIAKMIVEQLGGTLTFASNAQNGTTFTVSLPTGTR